MSLKMKELMKKTGESKSTILFYVKENLLPPPKKLKANLHLYSENSVVIIKFIKYLQSLNYTISEIKEIFKEAPLNRDSSFYMMVKALEIATVTKEAKFLSKEEFLQRAGIDEEELKEYIKRGYICQRDRGFGVNEVEIVKIIKKAKSLNLESSLIDRYLKSAKEIAKFENRVWAEVFKDEKLDTIEEYELLFDLVLKFKPYIYNIQTIKEYYNLKEGGER